MGSASRLGRDRESPPGHASRLQSCSRSSALIANAASVPLAAPTTPAYLRVTGVPGHEDGIDGGPRAFPRGDCPAPGERASQLRGEIGLRRAAC